MPNRPPRHPQRPKLKPGIDPQMVKEVEDAGGLAQACVTAVALMECGELPRAGARTVVHQLDLAIKQCHDFAHRPDWQHGRDAFLEFADMMAECRDDARDLVDDTE